MENSIGPSGPDPVMRVDSSSPDPGFGHIHWWLRSWKKFAVFSGRASRREYWSFAIWYYLFYGALLVLSDLTAFEGTAEDLFLGVFVLFSITVIIPGLAVTVRRIHDTDHSGWFYLIPFYGNVILLFLRGTSGTNRFGDEP